MGSYDVLTSMKEQKKASQPVLNLIYGNTTTGLKHSAVQLLILLSCSLGSRCCIWYGELQIVLLYHLNVISDIHWKQLRSCTLTGDRQESVFLFFWEQIFLGWQIFPVDEGCCFFLFFFSPPLSSPQCRISPVLCDAPGEGKSWCSDSMVFLNLWDYFL